MSKIKNDSGIELFISDKILKKVLKDNFPAIKKLINEPIVLKEVVSTDDVKVTDMMIKMDLNLDNLSIIFDSAENCLKIVAENYEFEILANFLAQKWFLKTEGSVLQTGLIRRIEVKFEIIEVSPKNNQNCKIPNIKATNSSIDLFDRDINLKITDSVQKWIVEPVFNNNACGAQTYLLKELEKQFETNKQTLLTKINQYANEQIEKYYLSSIKLPGPSTQLQLSMATSNPIKFYDQSLQFFIKGLLTPLGDFKNIRRTSYPKEEFLNIDQDYLAHDAVYHFLACFSNNFFMSFIDCLIDSGYQQDMPIPNDQKIDNQKIEYFKLKLVDWEKKEIKILSDETLKTKLAITLFTKFDNQELSNELKIEATIKLTKTNENNIQENKTVSSKLGAININFKIDKILEQKIKGVEQPPQKAAILKGILENNIQGRELNENIDQDKIVTQDFQKINKLDLTSYEGCLKVWIAADL